jgi:hypothetical protein
MREEYIHKWGLTDEQAQERGNDFEKRAQNFYAEELRLMQELENMDTETFM